MACAAPVPRKKEGRAARLAAMMGKDGNSSVTSLGSLSCNGSDLDLVDASVEKQKENLAPTTDEANLSKEVGEAVEDDGYGHGGRAYATLLDDDVTAADDQGAGSLLS